MRVLARERKSFCFSAVLRLKWRCRTFRLFFLLVLHPICVSLMAPSSAGEAVSSFPSSGDVRCQLFFHYFWNVARRPAADFVGCACPFSIATSSSGFYVQDSEFARWRLCSRFRSFLSTPRRQPRSRFHCPQTFHIIVRLRY